MFSSKSKTIPAGTAPVTGFASGQWVANAKKLWGKGMDVYLAGETEGGKHEQTKYLLAEDYLPKGAVVHIDGREFRIDNVDFNNDRVSLQDMTMLQQARFPIFRDEPIEFVRSYLEEEQPTIAQITADMAEQLRAEEEQTLDRITDVEDSERAMTDPKVEADVFEALEATHTAFEEYSPEQMDVIYSAAEKGYDLEPLCNPAFSPEQMQLISDIEGRMEARTRASFREVFDFITKNELSILITEINMKNYKSVNVINILTALTLLRNSHLTVSVFSFYPGSFSRPLQVFLSHRFRLHDFNIPGEGKDPRKEGVTRPHLYGCGKRFIIYDLCSNFFSELVDHAPHHLILTAQRNSFLAAGGIHLNHFVCEVHRIKFCVLYSCFFCNMGNSRSVNSKRNQCTPFFRIPDHVIPVIAPD